MAVLDAERTGRPPSFVDQVFTAPGELLAVEPAVKLASVSDEQIELLHFRERSGREVDSILESTDGRVVGIEVKASSSVTEHDFRHLAFVRDKIRDDFVAGIILYTGVRPLPFGDRLLALPVSVLWA